MLLGAHATHPERFVGGAQKPPAIPTEVWVNQPAQSIETEATAQQILFERVSFLLIRSGWS